MSELSRIQQVFWQAITADDPVSEAALQGTVAPSATLSPAQRVQIYATMVVDRLVEALAADFPNLARALGPGPFHALARDYLAEHPSQQPSIVYVGQHLEAYLRQPGRALPRPDPEPPTAWPPAADLAPASRLLGALADLAALEWARGQVFEAPAVDSVPATVLATLGEEALPRARFTFVPAMRRLESGYDTSALWRALEDEDEDDDEVEGEEAEPGSYAAGAERALPALDPHPSTLVVWRDGYRVLHTTLAPEAAEGLRRAQAGMPLEEVCEAFAALPHPVQAAFSAIGAWFADGWVAGLSA